MRMLSMQSNSMVYHRPECRYARKIYKKNRMQLPWQDAEWKGYRPCKCCNTMKFLYGLEQDAIEAFCKQQHNMDAEKVPYHRQRDMHEAGSIMRMLRYIQGHDEFRQFGPADYRQMPRRTRQQRYYYNSAKRLQEKRTARRLDSLFLMIEKKEGIKQLSMC